MLEVRSLGASYGAAQVLFDVTIDVAAGEVVALMGRNGAGKSTTLAAIVGLVDARAERVSLAGAVLTGAPTHRIVQAGLGWVPEDRRVFTRLSVAENLRVGARPPRDGLPAWTTERLFALFPNLAEVAGRPAGAISGGEQQMLAIARTLAGNPSMVLLDEPSEGLAPKIVERMADAIAEMKRHGLGVLLAEQNLRFAAAVADRAVVIERGHVRWEGAMADLLADEPVRDAYLAV